MNNNPGFLHQVFNDLTAFAQQHLAERRHQQERLAALRDAIEQVVDASEPRVRLVGNYAEKLVDAVEKALRYAEQALRPLPPPVTLDPRAWAIDARINAFFATAGDLREMLSRESEIRAFFAKGEHSECFALLLMLKREVETFGTALNGDLLMRDVRQIRVSFSGHRLFFPAASETQLRENLKLRTLVFLATRALEHINELRTRRSTLEEQRRQLQAQIRALRIHAQGLQPLLATGDADQCRLTALEQRLVQTEDDLVAARKQLGTLDDYLQQIRRVISEPEAYLQVRLLSLRLNRLGVKLPPDSLESGETLVLLELDSLGEQRIGVLVRIERSEMPPADF